MLHTWTVWCRHPAVGEKRDHAATFVSPTLCDDSDALAAVTDLGIGAPIKAVRHTLDYPAPSDAGEIVDRYRNCQRCHLSGRRNSICHMRGNIDAPIVMVGGGPGRTEDLDGRPFVGPKARLQGELLKECGIDPELDVAWITLVGCRPHDSMLAVDREPTTVELRACSERTLMLLQLIRPRVVVCLGKDATRMLHDEPPHPWTWTRVVPAESSDDWVIVGHARHPSYLARVIGMPANYKEYAAAIRFYTEIKDQMPLSRPSSWRTRLRYMDSTEQEAGS